MYASRHRELSSYRLRVTLLATAFACGIAPTLAAPCAAQEEAGSDPLRPVLDLTMGAYTHAASRSDSVRLADSALFITRAMLQRDSLNPFALLFEAKFLKERGDSVGEYRAIATLARSKFGITFLGMSSFLIDSRDVWTVLKKQGGLQSLREDSRMLNLFFHLARRARDWPAIVAIGPALIAADTSAANLSYYAVLLTAYDLLHQPAQVDAVAAQVAARFPAAGAREQWYTDALQQLQDLPLLQELMRVHPVDQALAQTTFNVAIQANAWPAVITVGETLARLDSAARDAAYFLHLTTAYDQLHQPEQMLTTAQQGTARFPATRELWRQYATALSRVTPASTSALTTAVQTLMQQHQDDLHFGGRLLTGLVDALAGFVDAADWKRTFAVWGVLAGIDSTAGDTLYVGPRVTRYDRSSYPDDPFLQSRLLIASAYDKRHQPQQAAAILARVTAVFPRNISAWLWYARELREAGRSRAAAEALEHGLHMHRDESHPAVR